MANVKLDVNRVNVQSTNVINHSGLLLDKKIHVIDNVHHNFSLQLVPVFLRYCLTAQILLCQPM